MLSDPCTNNVIEDFDKLMAINVRGLFLCMKYEIQQMLTLSNPDPLQRENLQEYSRLSSKLVGGTS